MLQAARKLDYDNNPKAVNFILFNDCKLNDDDMYWLTSMFNTHKSSLAVNTIDLSNNCIRLEKDNGLPFFSSIPKNVLNLDLSNNNIGDHGAKVIAEGFANGLLPITKFLNLGGNKITTSGFQKMKDIIGDVSQEVFIITETKYDTGKSIYKDTDSKFYEMSIKSDGKESAFEFANGITGISGVSSGDTCPAPVKDQILGCIKGAIPATAGASVGCGGTTVAYPVCIANAAIIGCGVGVIGVGLSPCVDNTYNNIETFLGGNRDHDKGDFSFSATGGTEIQGSYIDNSRGPMGSNIDLSQHDF